jgi:hypothetical protein
LRGVTLVSPGTAEYLLGASRSVRGDILVAVNIQVRATNVRKPDAAMVLRILDVQTGKGLWRGERVTTAQVAAAQRKRETDPVAIQADAAIQFIDEKVTLKAMPQLSAAAVEKRAAKIVGDTSLGKLAVLAELRLYEVKGWLPADKVRECYSDILGSSAAEDFMSKRLTDRQSAVKELVVVQ